MLSVDQIGKDEMGGACDLRETGMKDFGWKTWKKRNNPKDVGVDGRIKVKLPLATPWRHIGEIVLSCIDS